MKNLMKNVTNRNLSEIVNEGKKGIKGLFDGTLEEAENLNEINIDEHIEAVVEWANAGEEIVYKFEEDENIPQNGLIADEEDIMLWYSVASYDELKKEVEQEIEYQKEQRVEENKKKTTTIKQVGCGQGAGEEIEVLAQEEIEKIIKGLDFTECFKKAFDAMNPSYENGYCAVDLRTGNVITYSMSGNTSYQACDNNHVDVCVVDQNEENPFTSGDDEVIEEIKENYLEKFKCVDFDKSDYLVIEDCKKIDEETLEEIRDDLSSVNRDNFIHEGDFDNDMIDQQIYQFYFSE
jgi:hypothetical protein